MPPKTTPVKRNSPTRTLTVVSMPVGIALKISPSSAPSSQMLTHSGRTPSTKSSCVSVTSSSNSSSSTFAMWYLNRESRFAFSTACVSTLAAAAFSSRANHSRRFTGSPGAYAAFTPPSMVSSTAPSCFCAPLASMKLIAGLPTKSATNRLLGLPYTVSGSSYCWSTPFSIRQMRVASVMASIWSCVT